MFHKMVKDNLRGSLRILLRMFIFYLIACLAALYLGEVILNLFGLNTLHFLFATPLYYFSFPILVSSMAVGSIYVGLGSPQFCIATSLVSFTLTVTLLASGMSPELSFSIGVLFYTAVFCFFIYRRFYVDLR